jgi:hypothetical protein
MNTLDGSTSDASLKKEPTKKESTVPTEEEVDQTTACELTRYLDVGHVPVIKQIESALTRSA